MNKKLLIVFVKNKKIGQVKTRLAKTIGNEAALKVYEELINITKIEVSKLDSDKAVFFSEYEEEGWENFKKFVQKGEDLGEKMKNAFVEGFNQKYDSIVLIGSDLPDISNEIMEEAFVKLEQEDFVFGPAQDGGYYLIGLNKINENVFKNKPWSQSNLLEITLKELEENKVSFALLNTLNDIDEYEDLVQSKIFEKTKKYFQN
jgi:rSAM/selenodomain-associated transferase 1